ncbi:dTDP-4-dehydrorhamnose reductase [Bacillus sp. FJAT-45350]|uniref:dTDP-4-dehydrorhamnose reductase n=1 Tax=Bacillus sp. FJAT-45350 TaxID=2011014 RepID=UPI000BB9210F|nr:dTDP-4-dehydrorhamnose reductase [Bacillus sp. FJAT-45350]
MKHILITGANGQLGKELSDRGKEKFKVTSLGKAELDITNLYLVQQTVEHYQPDFIIHTAAFTNVDHCEVEKTKAFDINSVGASHIAMGANMIDSKMIYISSDYIFDGRNNRPYGIEDTPNPLNTYGKSKWLGERLVEWNTENCSVIRTSWLYGHARNNFVKTMLNLVKKGQPIAVVADEVGSPTYVRDLANYILLLLDKPEGTYHCSNSGSCSWYEFARKIVEKAGYDPGLIQPTTSKKYGSVAKRPAYSVLSHEQLNNVDLKTPRHWEEALDEFLMKELKL